MVTLKANHRQLTVSAKFTFLSTNYAAGVSSVIVINSDACAANDFILLGEFGKETSEIVRVNTVTAATHTLTLVSALKFSHSESARVTVLKYDQVKFYYTATATFSAATSLATSNIAADDYYTKYYDTTHATGFGWFVFYNSYTTTNSQPSNAIPYAGFAEGSVKMIMDSFFGLLSQKETKLITIADAYRYLNEGYATVKNELNMVNPEYNVPTVYSIAITASTAEYALPSDFGQMVSLSDSDGEDIDYIKVEGIRDHLANASATDIRYYLRSNYLGIVPTPTTATTYYLYYRKKADKLDSYYDDIDLPNNQFYFLVDFMMYRASDPLKRSLSEKTMYNNAFKAGLADLKTISYKQNANKDSWDIDNSANT